jgi:uncharacterized protein DUF1579
MKHALALSCAGILLSAGLAMAQAPAPAAPGPEHKNLAYFAGKWTFEGEMKASPAGPAGKMTGSESCEWFAGGFNLICNSTGTGPAGKVTGQSTMGYSTEGKHYTFYGIDSTGWSDSAKGSLEADTWTWTSEGTMGGKPVKSRYTVKRVSADSYTFKGEMSVAGGPFEVVAQGTETRAK